MASYRGHFTLKFNGLYWAILFITAAESLGIQIRMSTAELDNSSVHIYTLQIGTVSVIDLFQDHQILKLHRH